MPFTATHFPPDVSSEDSLLGEFEGELARARNVTSIDNPYLSLEACAPTESGQAARLVKCDAWWRGWDREHGRRARARASRRAAEFRAVA